MFGIRNKILMLEHRKLIVGLGNPGQKYANSKHNTGFRVIDEALRRAGITNLKGTCRALVGTLEMDGIGLIFAKPTTFMNNSGEAVAELVDRFRISLANLCVVYDDLNLELGVLRIRNQGRHGGHNGMKSIIRHLNEEEFPRLRIGIGAPSEGQIDYVLSEFDEVNRTTMDQAVHCAADALETIIQEGVTVAMNRFNGRVGQVFRA